MLLSAQATRYAHQLLEARAHARRLPPLSKADPAMSTKDGYDVAKSILTIRTAQGEDAVGRRLGFTHRSTLERHASGADLAKKVDDEPIWAPMFNTTVRFAEENHGLQSLRGAMQPHIEQHIVFMLGKAPAPDADLAALADCIEWMAPAFEIVVCPYPDWKFSAADAIAAFGLHGSLIVGEPKVLSEATRRNLADVLADTSVSLSVSTAESFILRAAGFGSDVLGSPVHALWRLHALLREQSQFQPLAAGEMIASGGWTPAYPVEAGQTWTSAFSGAPLNGLTVSFV
jgi:2-keto-4-pentenoate hydratase